MRVEAFGELTVLDAAGERLAVGNGRQATAFAVLCTSPGKSVSSETLAEAVWGEHPPERYARSLATYMSNLRRELGADIESTPNGYRLGVDRSAVDVADFVDRVEAADAGADDLSDALSLWLGEPFGRLEGHGLFRDERNRLGELRLTAERVVARRTIDAGDSGGALPALNRLVVDYPYDEQARALHMEALYRVGRQTEALRSYSSYRKHLGEDLGIEPSAALRDLELAILNQDLEATAPPPPVLEALVPNRYSSFVGRVQEVHEVRERLTASRLVSLVGPGGIGKSSIATEAVRDWEGAAVAVVPVEDITQGGVAMEIARTLGLAPGPGVDPLTIVEGLLSHRPYVLVLDGSEARIDEVAAIAHRLLTSTNCRIVVTSREPVGLTGETTVRVAPLPADDAVALFIDRAQLAVEPTDADLTTIREVCLAVDSMPLAVELAASRAASLPLDRMAARLSELIPLLRRPRGFDERHGSLLAALDWSFDLLDEAERNTLVSVSIFRTPFDEKAATDLTNDPATEDHLSRLVHVSLVQPPNAKGEYALLEPIRQYARHQLAALRMMDSIVAMHRDWAIAACRRAAIEEWTPRVREVRSWIFDKRAELLAVVHGCHERDDPDGVLAIIATVGRVFNSMGWSEDVRETALAALDHPKATRGRDWVRGASNVAWMLVTAGQEDEAQALAQRAVECAEATSDLPALKSALQRLAVCSGTTGWNEQSLDVISRAESVGAEGMAEDPDEIWLHNKARILRMLDRMDEALVVSKTVDEWWITNIGEGFWGYQVLRAEALMLRGDPAGSLEAATLASDLARAELNYEMECDALEHAAYAAAIVGADERLAHAVERRRQISALTGRAEDMRSEIIIASNAGDHSGVLSLCRRWFTEPTYDSDYDYLVNEVDRDYAIYGLADDLPPILEMLPWLLPALMHTGSEHDARRIAAALPSIIEEAPYHHWNPLSETDLMSVPEPSEEARSQDEYEPLDLEGLFYLVRDLVTAHDAE